MGMLTYGAMAGVGGEYLKQSGETRQAGFQEIRDKRLSELKKVELTHAAEAQEKGAQAQRDYESKNYSFGYGENVVRGGEVVQTGGDRPTAASTKAPTGNLIAMVSGDSQTEEQIRKTYDSIWKANTDEFGNRIGDFDLPPYDEWRNTRVQPQHRINPQAGEPPAPTEPDTAAFEQARKEYGDKASMWSSDESQFGMSEDEWVDKRAGELMKEKGGKKQGGMLTEGTKPKEEKSAPVKLKTPLSQASKTDPVQMYEELMAQFGADQSDTGEQDVIDTIRKYFHDPLWNPPANMSR